MAVIAAYMVPHPPLIVPEVGRGGEEQIAETARAYRRAAAEIAKLKPETLVITSPHTVMYRDYFHISPGREASGSFAQFHAPGVRFRVEYDTVLRDAVCRLAEEACLSAGTRGERESALDHGVMVPLYFIREAMGGLGGVRILRVGLSGLSFEEHYALGQAIGRAAEETGRRVVFVASGDLSHRLKAEGPYGFAPEGPEYDEKLMDVCSRAAFGELMDFGEDFCDRAAECGHRSFIIMAGALDGRSVEAEAFSHQDVTGVGYGICAFRPGGEDTERRFLEKRRGAEAERLDAMKRNADPWADLARRSVESYVLRRRVMPVPEGLPEEMLRTRAGAFVSIHKGGQLRGCIGTIAPTRDSLAEEIIHNTVSAAVRDPRFDPIAPEELKWLEIHVDVLGEPEEIASEEELDVKKYGVIVTRGHRRGLLLPDLEGVDTVAQQVAIARQKAGIAPGEKVSLQRFRVVRHT